MPKPWLAEVTDRRNGRARVLSLSRARASWASGWCPRRGTAPCRPRRRGATPRAAAPRATPPA
eukprot:2599998-Pleurochrysis_carterae.AAC.1